MEILLESFMENHELTKSPLHLRYHGMGVAPMDDWQETVKAHVPTMAENEKRNRRSIIVIRQPYAFMAPAILSMFEGAKDVRVIVDRRLHNRRQSLDASVPVNRRKETRDRRSSSPMLDIIINIEE
jgi:hypothetical protein